MTDWRFADWRTLICFSKLQAYQFLNQKKKKRSGRAMTENWSLVCRPLTIFFKEQNGHQFNHVTAFLPKVGGKAGSKALVGGLLSKLKAGALAESRGEENPGMVKMSLPPVEAANKVSTEVGKPASLALGVTEGEAAPDWSAWEAS